MIKLRLTHGMSHSNGIVSATMRKPYVTVETEEEAAACVAGGFFEIVHPGTQGAQERAEARPETRTPSPAEAVQEAAEHGRGAMDADPAPQQEDDGLDGMTLAELKAYAETVGIDLGKATRKADIIAVIRKEEGKA